MDLLCCWFSVCMLSECVDWTCSSASQGFWLLLLEPLVCSPWDSLHQDVGSWHCRGCPKAGGDSPLWWKTPVSVSQHRPGGLGQDLCIYITEGVCGVHSVWWGHLRHVVHTSSVPLLNWCSRRCWLSLNKLSGKSTGSYSARFCSTWALAAPAQLHSVWLKLFRSCIWPQLFNSILFI